VKVIAVSIQLKKFLISSIRKPSFHLLLENHWSVCVNYVSCTRLFNLLSRFSPISLITRPHPREESVWWHLADSLGFIKNS